MSSVFPENFTKFSRVFQKVTIRVCFPIFLWHGSHRSYPSRRRTCSFGYCVSKAYKVFFKSQGNYDALILKIYWKFDFGGELNVSHIFLWKNHCQNVKFLSSNFSINFVFKGLNVRKIFLLPSSVPVPVQSNWVQP